VETAIGRKLQERETAMDRRGYRKRQKHVRQKNKFIDCFCLGFFAFRVREDNRLPTDHRLPHVRWQSVARGDCLELRQCAIEPQII
jgi:hypothetical protein